MSLSLPIHGRGAAIDPANRFDRVEFEPDGDHLDAFDPAERVGPRTQVFTDATRSIVVANDSPDIPFEASVNVYRGCEHGWPFCQITPDHFGCLRA